MERFLFLMVFSLLICNGLHAQTEEDPKNQKLPQEKVTVNKEFDENGNMVRFDSTYVFSWSGDSLLMNLPGNLDLSGFFKWQENIFGADSLFLNDPFGSSFFDDKKIEELFEHFSKMFSDSLAPNGMFGLNRKLPDFFPVIPDSLLLQP